MDSSFIPIETVPSKTPFGLDQLRRSYKTALSAEDAIAAAPAVGTADESFPNMFLMPITTPESAERATQIDLVYMGSLAGTEGNPTLPAQRNESSDAVQSASGSRGQDGTTLTSPISVQYYAPSKQLEFITFGGEGERGTVDDPADDVRIITFTLGDTSYSFTGLVPELIANFFMPLVVNSLQSTEIVPGQYWLNVERKIKTLVPWIFDFTTPGAYVGLSSPGAHYVVGNFITISSGGESATITVDSLIGIAHGIYTFTVTSNTFTVAHDFLPAIGGTGTGAKFNVFIIA